MGGGINDKLGKLFWSYVQHFFCTWNGEGLPKLVGQNKHACQADDPGSNPPTLPLLLYVFASFTLFENNLS